MKTFKWGLLVLASTALVACGGGNGGSDGGTKLSFSSVKVFGDSIADSGTYRITVPNTTNEFGLKFTVQNSANLQAGYPIWPELVAKTYGVNNTCPYFRFNQLAGTFVKDSSCFSFAVGGGRINQPGVLSTATPSSGNMTSIPLQMAVAGGLIGSYSATDLVLIDGGGNDAADLVGAFLAIPADQAASFTGLVGTLLPPATIGAILGATPTTAEFAKLGGAYMQALADKFAADIAANVTGKGATHVAVLNMPDVTGTPRFQMVLAAVAQQSSAANAAAVAGIVDQWTQAFNAKLAANVAPNASIAVVDFYSSFKDELVNPGSYSLTNVKTPACPSKGLGPDGLPAYDFPTCSDAALDAAPPPGAMAGWWKSYAFSDSFHPTPYGHDLLARYINLALAKKGWL